MSSITCRPLDREIRGGYLLDMGHFSFSCKHCDRPIHDSQTVWHGINDWMTEAVVLLANGSVIIGEYDGYGRVGNMEMQDEDRAVWVHKSCWKHACKPEFSTYNGPSTPCQHGSWDDEDVMHEPGARFDPESDEWGKALAEREKTILSEKTRVMGSQNVHSFD